MGKRKQIELLTAENAALVSRVQLCERQMAELSRQNAEMRSVIVGPTVSAERIEIGPGTIVRYDERNQARLKMGKF